MLLSTAVLPALASPDSLKRNWPAALLLAVALLLYVLAAFSLAMLGPGRDGAIAGRSGSRAAVPGLGTPPEPEPMRFRDVAPKDALAINAAVPISDLPNPPARPFAASFATPLDRLRATECLTAAVYYEAAIEPLEGQRAVAQVVLNRVRHPAYPRTVCGVVFQGWERSTGCQFTFTCDGGIRRTPSASLWARARRIAEEAIAGKVYAPVGWATHYHTNWVVPYWSSSLVKAAIVGTHIFYRWTGGWGTGPAFRSRYAGTEMDVTKLRHLSTVPAELAAGGEAGITDLAAAAEAAKAMAAGDSDSLGRTVIRRYEPAKAEGVASLMASQARTSGDTVSASYRWALTGATGGGEAPLGRKADAKTAEAKPAPPRELEGVRRVGEAAGPVVTR